MGYDEPAMRKREILHSVLDQIKRRYGEDSILWLGESLHLDLDTISTGSLSLDIALGTGGIPRGRIVEIFGPESSGKTTLALHLIAEAQRRGGTAAFIDAEHALDPNYTRAIGVDLDGLLLSQPNSGEQALEITEHLIRSGAVEIIVVDSVAALVPEAEIAGSMGDAQVGLQARLMSQAMRKLTSAVGGSKTALVFINQIRSRLAATSWGPSTTTSGGLALKFYASVRLEIKRLRALEESGKNVGVETVVRVVKNKLAPPFKEARFDIFYGVGISRERELITLGEQLGAIRKNGSWYICGDERLGPGLANAAELLKERRGIAAQLEQEIYVRSGLLQGTNSRSNEHAKRRRANKKR
jgi:recombination protein RecA